MEKTDLTPAGHVTKVRSSLDELCARLNDAARHGVKIEFKIATDDHGMFSVSGFKAWNLMKD